MPPKRGVTPQTRPTTLATAHIRYNTPPYLVAERDENGHYIVILGGGVQIIQQRGNGDYVELRAQQAVLFTTVTAPADLQAGASDPHIQDDIVAVYLQGDVQIETTSPDPTKPEQRLSADQVYYEFATDRAILTNAVFHSMDVKRQVPIIIRADMLRQLSTGEFNAEHATMTTSSFATPSYSISADKVYIRQVDTGDPYVGWQTEYIANNDVLKFWGLPVFYTPYASGVLDNTGYPLRDIEIGSTSQYGFGVATTWGIFETAGVQPPRGLDATFAIDYFANRGEALGLGADYDGGLVDSRTKQPWDFFGDFKSIIMTDNGTDTLGGARTDVTPPTDIRGRVLWDHEQFYPDNWELQARLGYASDATFLPEWYPDEFNDDLPENASIYLKHQSGSEAYTFLGEISTTPFVTTADQMQEQFDVERLPEVTYHRIGDSFDDDQLTFYSDTSLDALRMAKSHASLADQGFQPGLSPGLPDAGTTGLVDGINYRADSREEVDDPINLGPLRAMPYVVGRYTGYSDSPTDSEPQRVLGAAGIRFVTDFWKVDPTVESDLLDLHELRHIIEPEVDLYTSAENVSPDDVTIYEQNVDELPAISAASFDLRQEWQTQRGGPGHWQSVDAFTLDLQADFFSHKPPNSALTPDNFRTLYFASDPEASIPRDGFVANAGWRISDTTAILSDADWNYDRSELATAAVGFAVQRDPRVSYYLGVRYVDPLNSNIGSALISYQLTEQYSVALNQNYDFDQSRNVSSAVTIIRHLDRLIASLSIYTNSINGQSGFEFNIIPEGLDQKGQSASQVLTNTFGPHP
jgi:lipopolysaccharide assembly outer membrane protein LptD (OstA)